MSMWQQEHHHHWLDAKGGIQYTHPLSLSGIDLDDPNDWPGEEVIGPPCHLPCEAAGAKVWT